MAVSARFRLALTALVSGMLLCAAPAWAQVPSEPPLTETGGTLVLEAKGHTITMPLPDWLDEAERLSGDVQPLVETRFVSDETTALLEIFPRGESPALWNTLYGARITLQSGRSLADYRSAVMLGYSQTCKPELTGFFQLGADDGDNLAPLGFVCGAYLDRLTSYTGLGEVMVMSFRKSERGVAIVYQEWRGAAFDPSNPQTWPVPTDVVQARVQELQATAALSLAD